MNKNVLSNSITRKLGDSSRVNRLPLKGSEGETQSQGMFIPVSEMGGFGLSQPGMEHHVQS